MLPEPAVRRVALPNKGARLIIASDGLWDAMNPRTAVHHVRGMQAGKAAGELVLSCCPMLHCPAVPCCNFPLYYVALSCCPILCHFAALCCNCLSVLNCTILLPHAELSTHPAVLYCTAFPSIHYLLLHYRIMLMILVSPQLCDVM